MRARVRISILAGALALGAAGLGTASVVQAADAGPVLCKAPDHASGPSALIAPSSQTVECADLQVTKVVDGQAPSDTHFVVIVDCKTLEKSSLGASGPSAQTDNSLPTAQTPPFTDQLVFDNTGGTQHVFLDNSATCTIDEDPPAGCTLTSINPSKLTINAPVVFESTVTNDCQAPPAVVPPAVVPAAAPVVGVTPKFTG
jgi:hypothetical protein